LTEFRYTGDPQSEIAQTAIGLWTSQFAGACVRACNDAESFERRTHEIEAIWRNRVGTIRANSAVDLLLQVLPGAPVFTVPGAMTLINRSFPATNNAVATLVAAQILNQITVGERNRAYEAPEIITAFTNLERQLASPLGDTQHSTPSRKVPKSIENKNE